MAESIIHKRLTYYSRSFNNVGTVNVLMVSVSQIYLDTVGKDLYVTREVQSKKRQYSLKVHTCKTILDVLENMPDEFYVDFIVFIIDPGVGNCLYEIETNLTFIDSCFPREKMCIVVPEASFLKSMVSPIQIWEFARKYQLNVINGQIKNTKYDGGLHRAAQWTSYA
ncbi:hypothetical protein RUM43_006271 [Polyplax serrata]|uniref:Uncharacterized protein n=1 Tax=Polyplax serrata TaxID=468196 RepID=A0AAN8NXK6_POLSC